MNKFGFEKLEVYQKALNFTAKIIDVCEKLPPTVRYALGSNLIRAAISIANNIAEGSGRRGKKEKHQFYTISQGSCYECVPIITVFQRKRYISQSVFEELYPDCFSIAQMLTKLIASTDRDNY